jgi:hypothetical protein
MKSSENKLMKWSLIWLSYAMRCKNMTRIIGPEPRSSGTNGPNVTWTCPHTNKSSQSIRTTTLRRLKKLCSPKWETMLQSWLNILRFAIYKKPTTFVHTKAPESLTKTQKISKSPWMTKSSKSAKFESAISSDKWSSDFSIFFPNQFLK